VRWVGKHPRHAKMVRLVEYRYLIISTRASWHMIKFKIHALECTRTRHFYVKKFKNFLGRGHGPLPRTIPQREGDTRGGLQFTSAGTERLKPSIALNGKLTSELRSVTCHMGSQSVTCHLTHENAPRHNPSQPGRYSIYLVPTPGRMEG